MDIRKFSLSQVTVNEWNKLDTEFVSDRCVNIIIIFNTSVKFSVRVGYMWSNRAYTLIGCIMGMYLNDNLVKSC